jgi:MscS family membrane protein
MNLFDQLPEATRDTLLRLLLAALALAIIWLLRRVLAWILIAPLHRLAQRSSVQWDEYLLEAAILPGRFIVFAVGLYVGAQILVLDLESHLFVERLIRSLFIIAIFLVVYRAVDVLTTTSVRLFRVTGVNVEDALLPFVRTGIKIAIVAILLVIVIGEWGYDVTGLIAGLGLGGLAISLAAQDTIANLFGFSAIVGDRPFMLGEFIKTADVEGTVEHVGLRSTRIRQPDQALVSIPNSKLVSSAILNWSRLSKRWVNLTLRITYEASAAQIQALLEQLRDMLTGREYVEPDSVIVFFTNIGEQALEVLVRCYIPLPDWAEFSREKEKINLDILRIVEELGLQIAVPNRLVYITPPLSESSNEESTQP